MRKRNASMTLHTFILIALVIAFSMVIAPVSAEAGAGDLTVTLTAPAATFVSSDDTQVVYQVDDLVDYQNVSLVWNFSNGLDENLGNNKQQVTLKTSGGDVIDINEDQELVYTKQNEPVELRQLALTMVDNALLQPDTDYIVELGADIISNNDNTLGKAYAWRFTTTAEEDSSGESGPVSWPDGSQITASNITPSSLTLTWTEAANASQYKVFQDDSEIKTLSSSVLSCDITGLAAKTPYEFKVEAGDAADVFTTDGPVAAATTAGQLEITAYSPASSEVPDIAKIDYQVTDQLEPDEIHFVWDFSKGMDKKLVSNLSKITLKKSDGTEVNIDRGSLTQAEISGDIIELGDFKYTKQAESEVRRLELILTSCTLEAGATYKLKLASDIEANNGDKLWLNHLWTFATVADVGSSNGGDDGDEGDTDTGGGTGTDTSDAMTVEFDAVDLSPEHTELWLDFSKGIDENLSSNVGQIKIYEEDSDKSISYDYEYVREGKTETGDKVRRLVLYLNDLEPRTTYEIEIGEDVTANNGSTLDDEYIFEFTTKSSSTSTEETEEEVIEEVVPETQLPASPASVNLNDINGHWAQMSIEQLVQQGAISGYPDGTFKPAKTITRAEFAYVLVKALALETKAGKTFADTASHWAREAIATAEGYGIVNGYDDNRFGPDDVISREQICVMLQKAFQLTTAGEPRAFSDSDFISEWAVNAVYACSANSIVSGYEDNSFRPQNSATRAEAVSMIVRALAVNPVE